MDKAKQMRHEALLGAMDRIGKEDQDEDSLFCRYVASRLRTWTELDRREAHERIFNILNEIEARRN